MCDGSVHDVVEYARMGADAVLVGEALVKDRIHEISFSGIKKDRYSGLKKLLEEVKVALAEKYPEQEKAIAGIFSDLERDDIRKTIIEKIF